MPQVIQFRDRGSGDPIAFYKIDDQMRELFGEPEDEDRWLYNWFERLGMLFSVMARYRPDLNVYEEARKLYSSEPVDSEMLRVVDFLQHHYSFQSWRA